MHAELATLQSFDVKTNHRDAERLLRAAGWTYCGAGDWAIALRSPSGAYAARISPFDPAAPYNAALYRRAAHTGQVPRIEAELALEGGGSLLALQFLHPVEPERATAYHRSIALREPEVEELSRLVATVHRAACRELPWCGPLDTNPTNVMQTSDGRLVLIDPFYADGPSLYATVLSDPARVAASIAPEKRRYMLDLPLHQSGPAEPAILEQMRGALAHADIARGPTLGTAAPGRTRPAGALALGAAHLASPPHNLLVSAHTRRAQPERLWGLMAD